MTNQAKPLPGAGAIISDTWKFFTSTWNTSVKTSVLFLYVGMIMFASGLLVYTMKGNVAFSVLDSLVGIAAAVFTYWISIRITLTMLNLEAGKNPLPAKEESSKAWSLFWPMAWVGFLATLVIFGASLLLILPGIYFAVALAFTQIILVDQNIRGTQALGASRALVKERWWGTFWRQLAGAIVFGLLIGGVSMAGIAVVAGSTGVSFKDLEIGSSTNYLFNAASNLVMMMIYAAFMPLLVGFQVKLYRALMKTK